MSEPLVRAKALSRTYFADGETTTALNAADFEIVPGELIALTGPSGSGKTTMLHLISGIDVPSSGSIEWPALGARSVLRPCKISIAFQGPSLLPALTVAENVALPLLLGGSVTPAEASEAAAEIIDRMGLEELGPKLPEDLSGGQSQRVGLARALVVRPSLLLADEPTGQQDHVHAARLLEFLFAFTAEHGTAVLAATHDPHVAERFTVRWNIEDGALSVDGGAPC